MAPPKNTPKPAEPKVEDVPDPVTPEKVNPPVPPTSVDEDAEIQAALARKTQDGKGDDPVPPADFQSFATEGVEKGSLTLAEISQQVLDSKWGWDWRPMVEAAGYDASEIQTEVNRRIATGAPSGLPKLGEETVAKQVLAGEWGDTEVQVRTRLDGAGHIYRNIALEVARLSSEG